MFDVTPVGVVSTLERREDAPRQGDEGAPEAWIVFGEAYVEALHGLAAVTDVFLLTWLDRADRTVLQVHPRGEADRPLTGIFATRSADRPNPVGLHRVRILAIEGSRLRVDRLEVLNGTPVIDVKPVLGEIDER